MRPKLVFTLAFFTILLGCAATQKDVRQVYGRQTRLEAEMKQLSQDIEVLKAKGGENSRVKSQIAQLERRLRSVEQDYSELKKNQDIEVLKTKKLKTQIAQLEHRLKSAEHDYSELNKKLDELKKEEKVSGSEIKTSKLNRVMRIYIKDTRIYMKGNTKK